MGLRFVLQTCPPFISLNMHFLFVRPRLCRQLPSDSQSPTTPLLLANDSYYQVHRGLAPPSYRPCRAHNSKGPVVTGPCNSNKYIVYFRVNVIGTTYHTGTFLPFSLPGVNFGRVATTLTASWSSRGSTPLSTETSETVPS